MSIMKKTLTQHLCKHVASALRAISENGLLMGHDFQGTYLHCPNCDCAVDLEAYGQVIEEDDYEGAEE